MARVKAAILTATVSVNVQDKWAAKKAQLEELSAAQAAADIAAVEAQRQYNAAAINLTAATAAKTAAEKRLASFRANLGAE